MNNYPQELYTKVYETLSKNEATRNSDLELYKSILNDFYGTTDLSRIYLVGDIFSSIKRCRQKIQHDNPFLGPKKEVKLMREDVEQKYLNFVRNW